MVSMAKQLFRGEQPSRQCGEEVVTATGVQDDGDNDLTMIFLVVLKEGICSACQRSVLIAHAEGQIRGLYPYRRLE
jgi:hypothetical protein